MDQHVPTTGRGSAARQLTVQDGERQFERIATRAHANEPTRRADDIHRLIRVTDYAKLCVLGRRSRIKRLDESSFEP